MRAAAHAALACCLLATLAAAAAGDVELEPGEEALLHRHRQSPPVYEFQRFPYRKKSRWGRQVKQALRKCEADCKAKLGLRQDAIARGLDEADGVLQAELYDLELTRCSRVCASPKCHETVYGADPLEVGEVDVRANSFRGCVSQERMQLAHGILEPEHEEL